MEKVLITGVGGPAGRASAQFFRDRGYAVIGTDIVPVEERLDGFSLVPRGDDPDFSAAILDLLRRERPALFVPTVTEELPFTARLKREVRSLGISMYSSEPEYVFIANDKYLTALLLATAAIPVPHTLCDVEICSARKAGGRLGYPMVAKPRHGRGGRGVKVYFSPEEAEAESREGIVCQEFVGGEEYDVNLFISPAGRPIVSRVLLKTKLKEGIVGNALSVEPVECEDVAGLAAEAARVLKLEGPVDMDVRRTESGLPKILEVNARVGANVLSAASVLESLVIESKSGGKRW